MWVVYILKSINRKTFYKGLSNDIDRRIKQHFNKEVKSTKSLLPLKLVHVEICESRSEARKLERYFKSGYGREIIKEIDERS